MAPVRENEKRLPNMVLSHQHSKMTTQYGAQSTTRVLARVYKGPYIPTRPLTSAINHIYTGKVSV